MKGIVLGGGCFWCIEAIFQRVKGVQSVISGYSGGTDPEPNYSKVSRHIGNHAEVVKITYDEGEIGLEELLDIFFHSHDPTTLNKQGADVGPQYRSIVFYADESEKKTIEYALKNAQKDWSQPIVTQVKPLEDFYKAEDYHQNFFNNNPQQGYCSVVISPKLHKLQEKYVELMSHD